MVETRKPEGERIAALEVEITGVKRDTERQDRELGELRVKVDDAKTSADAALTATKDLGPKIDRLLTSTAVESGKAKVVNAVVTAAAVAGVLALFKAFGGG